MRSTTEDSQDGLLICEEAQVTKMNPGVLYVLRADAFLYSSLPLIPEECQKTLKRNAGPIQKISPKPSSLHWCHNISHEQLAEEIRQKDIKPDTFILSKQNGTWRIFYFSLDRKIKAIDIKEMRKLNAFLNHLPHNHPTSESLHLSKKIELELHQIVVSLGIAQIHCEHIQRNEKVILHVLGILPKGTEVMASYPVMNREAQVENPFYMQARVFCKDHQKIEGMSETGNEVLLRDLGFISRSHLALKDEKSWANAPLFPNGRPSSDEIHQSTLGDCYLLANLISMLRQEHGINFIVNMMRQISGHDGRKHVRVRLFDPYSGEPIYIELYSMYYNAKKIRHKALWVHIIEAAYASLGYDMQGGKIRPSDPSFGARYANGGDPTLAAKILMGADSITFFLNPSQKKPILPFDEACISAIKMVFEILKAADETSLQDFIKNPDKKYPDFENEVIKLFKINLLNDLENIPYFFEHEENILLTFRFIVESNPNILGEEKVIEKYPEFIQIMQNLKSKTNSVLLCNTLEEAYFKLHALYNFNDGTRPLLPVELLKNLLADIRQERKIENFRYYLYPECAGFGYYAEKEIKILLNLQSKLNIGVLTASTYGKSNKETWPQGLYPKHTYAITGLSTEIIHGQELHFVHVQNPWGCTGIVYHWPQDLSEPKSGKAVTEEGKSGEFKVELRHFIECFECYCYTPAKQLVHGTKSDYDVSKHLQVEKQEEIQAEIKEIIQSPHLSDQEKIKILLNSLLREMDFNDYTRESCTLFQSKIQPNLPQAFKILREELRKTILEGQFKTNRDLIISDTLITGISNESPKIKSSHAAILLTFCHTLRTLINTQLNQSVTSKLDPPTSPADNSL